MSTSRGRLKLISWILAVLTGCDPSGSEKKLPVPEPVDRIVDLKADASTMKEMAEQLSESTGIEFRLARGVNPRRAFRNPYQVFLPGQNLKEHLTWLEKDMEMWGFTWTGRGYEIRVIKPEYVYK